ncbi:TetR family transcriptional regulator C-terminal domain-containing protein [Geodermatophilus sp. SYSU D00079]
MDLALEADRLHAVVDGLTPHTLVRPSALPPARVRQVIAAHLDELCDRR